MHRMGSLSGFHEVEIDVETTTMGRLVYVVVVHVKLPGCAERVQEFSSISRSSGRKKMPQDFFLSTTTFSRNIELRLATAIVASV